MPSTQTCQLFRVPDSSPRKPLVASRHLPPASWSKKTVVKVPRSGQFQLDPHPYGLKLPLSDFMLVHVIGSVAESLKVGLPVAP